MSDQICFWFLRKCTVFIFAGIAIRTLLRGAYEAKVHTHSFKKYVKRGTYGDAYKEFMSLNPTDVRRIRSGKRVKYLSRNVRKCTHHENMPL